MHVVVSGRGLGGGFMAGGVSKVCQRSCWGRWLIHRSGGCYWSIQNKCGIVLSCLNVHLCYVVVILAKCCGWVRMSVSVP
jgi:hypothetical protein